MRRVMVQTQEQDTVYTSEIKSHEDFLLIKEGEATVGFIRRAAKGSMVWEYYSITLGGCHKGSNGTLDYLIKLMAPHLKVYAP